VSDPVDPGRELFSGIEPEEISIGLDKYILHQTLCRIGPIRKVSKIAVKSLLIPPNYFSVEFRLFPAYLLD